MLEVVTGYCGWQGIDSGKLSLMAGEHKTQKLSLMAGEHICW